MKALAAACMCLLLLVSDDVAGAETVDPLAWLEAAQAKIEDHRLSPADVGAIQAQAQGGDPARASLARGLLVTHARMAGDSIQAIRNGASILGVPAPALTTWQKALGRAKVKDQPVRLTEPLPPLPTEIPAEAVPAALALAVTLGSIDALSEGAALIQSVGLEAPGLNGVRAREAAGDLRCRPGSYGEAVELYQRALDASNHLLAPSSEGQPWQEPTAQQVVVEARLKERLARAQRLWDEERYGPGFVAYREAEHLRREQNRNPEALLAYEDIVAAFPATVWSEAAAAYRAHCLFAMAQTASAALDLARPRCEEVLTLAQQRLDAQRRAGAPKEILAATQAAVLIAKQRVARLAAQPRGAKAAAAAQQIVEERLRAAEFGLYRGELLLADAAWAMEGLLDPVAATKALDRTWDWLERVGKVDADLAALRVPAQASTVAAAPAESLTPDQAGVPARSVPAIGAVINRQTCGWYLDDLREQVALGRAFIAFSADNRDEAERWCLAALTLEGPAGRMDRQGSWNDVSRLRWAIEHGWLYAHSEELARYQGRQRFIVLVADFRFCCQRFDRARILCERMLAGDFGALRGADRDYPRYLLAASHFWEGDRELACAGYQEVLAQREGTLSEDRAAIALGNLSWSNGVDAAVTRAGHQALMDLAHSPRDNEFALRARIILGVRLIKTGKETEGLALLKRIPAAAEAYHELAQGWIAAVTGLRASAPASLTDQGF
jgi:tetratricopeptide (TPR) repeat protein